jgi:hypothetical protein
MATAGLVALLLGLLGSAASAQTQTVARTKSPRAPLEAAANALGMERGVRRELTSINAIFFTGTGSMRVTDRGKATDRNVSAVIGMSYFIPAIRSDITWQNPKGEPQRLIEVANAERAWNESEPGLGATSTQETAAERLIQVWLTPQGALRAMVDARAKDPNAVTISQVEGRAQLAMSFQGGPLEVWLDTEQRPAQLRWQRKGQALEVSFTDYKDWELLDVFFPQHIVQRIDGRVVMDLAVTDFRSNPYVVFPIPAQLEARKP